MTKIDPNSAEQWQPFLEPARLFLEMPRFEERERGYKLRVAQLVSELANAVRTERDVQALLTKALRHKHNNLLSWQLVDNYLKWAASDLSSALPGLAVVFDPSNDLETALTGFLAELPKSVVSGTGSRLSLASFFLLGRGEPEETPPYRWQVVQQTKELVGWQSESTSDEDEYLDTVRMFNSFALAARDAGIGVESALHAQGVLYAISKWEPNEDWSPDLRHAVVSLRQTSPTTTLSLAKALAQYDRSEAQALVDAGVDNRSDFVSRFPANVWPDVALESYALGLPESGDSVCYALEYSTVNCGSIRGGSANKYLLYFSAPKDAYKFETKYSDENEAWNAIREGIAELVRCAATGDFDEIDTIDALWAGASMRTKLAWMYFPDQLLPIYADSHLDYWLSIFGVSAGKLGRVAKNRLLFDTVTAMPEFEGWQTLEIMRFLYSWSEPNTGRTIVKIAPGRDAFLWQDCVENGTIRLGWDGTADLSQFDNDDELRAHYESINPDENKSLTTRTVRALKTFRDLEAGDIIIANEGTKKVRGIGRVTAGYRFEPDFAEYRHVVDVDWFDTIERDVDFGSAWMFTLVHVKADDYHRILRQDRSGKQILPPVRPPAVPALHREAERLLDRSGQLIFYGPPGTGKTFTARRHAAWLLRGGSSNEQAARAFGSSSQLHEIESDLLAAERTSFEDTETPGGGTARLTRVTFHPTYAYEDFIEGYKPTESGNAGLELRMKDGVFKTICRAAATDPHKPYVIMIDEINRGNVPKVFGELITLIEKDKRGMTLTLPQSGQSFHVPPNLHIIATMNTADRSVHVLDSALRRRFSFMELMPSPELLDSKVGPMPLEDFLSGLNTAIRSEIGREKQVGHAVLMNGGEAISTAADFALAFKYELLPLLQEYTYGNYNDLARLLGPEVVDEERQTPRLEIIEDPERLVEALAKHLEIG